MSDDSMRSRRSVLLTAAGSAAAAAAVALGRPASALGADGGSLLLGEDNHAESITALTRDTVHSTQDATLVVENNISAAVVGHATSGQGVIGRSQTSAGVQGYSQTDAGVNGFGFFGVWATGDGFGLFGTTSDGEGVHGESVNGTGGSFASENASALSTSGRLHFERVSGVATIPAGSFSKVIALNTDLSGDSFLLLTPRGSLVGRDLWYTVDLDADTFRLRLSKPLPYPIEVGWLIID